LYRKCDDKGCIQHNRNLSRSTGSTVKNDVQHEVWGFCVLTLEWCKRVLKSEILHLTLVSTLSIAGHVVRIAMKKLIDEH